MDETTQADAGAAPRLTDIVERVAGGEGPMTARAAAHSLIDARNKQAARERKGQDNQDTDGEAARDGAALAEQSSLGAEPGNGAGPDSAPGETQGSDQAASPEDAPPIAPPRSWTKEDKELFKGLPRETQERLVERERSREGDFLRRQNEAAEKLKGLSAREQAMEQAKRQYESALPALLQSLQEQAGEFADIHSLADIERVAREDWPRYVRWDAQQKKIAGYRGRSTRRSRARRRRPSTTGRASRSSRTPCCSRRRRSWPTRRNSPRSPMARWACSRISGTTIKS